MTISYIGRPQLSRLDLNSGNVTPYALTHYFRADAVARTQKDVPLIELTASRWERNSPERLAAVFGNKVNASGWRGTYPAMTVITSGVSWRPDPTGGYLVDYGFTYNPETWLYEETISVEGKTPRDVRIRNGIERFEIYPRANFAAFGLG